MIRGCVFGYTGHGYDAETGLYQYRARYYHPRLGQFLSTDPIGTKDDPNLTLYVRLDPVNHTDPEGMCSTRGDRSRVGNVLCEVTGVTPSSEGEPSVKRKLAIVYEAYAHYNSGNGEDASIDVATFANDIAVDFQNLATEWARGLRSGNVALYLSEARRTGQPQSVTIAGPTEARFGTSAFALAGRTWATLSGTLTVSDNGPSFVIEGTFTLNSELFDFNDDPNRVGLRKHIGQCL